MGSVRMRLNLSFAVSGLKQAQAMCRVLEPLEDRIERFLSCDANELKSEMELLMHQVATIWVNCKYYRAPSRIIVLLQEVCNMVTDVVSTSEVSTQSCNSVSDFISRHLNSKKPGQHRDIFRLAAFRKKLLFRKVTLICFRFLQQILHFSRLLNF